MEVISFLIGFVIIAALVVKVLTAVGRFLQRTFSSIATSFSDEGQSKSNRSPRSEHTHGRKRMESRKQVEKLQEEKARLFAALHELPYLRIGQGQLSVASVEEAVARDKDKVRNLVHAFENQKTEIEALHSEINRLENGENRPVALDDQHEGVTAALGQVLPQVEGTPPEEAARTVADHVEGLREEKKEAERMWQRAESEKSDLRKERQQVEQDQRRALEEARREHLAPFQPLTTFLDLDADAVAQGDAEPAPIRAHLAKSIEAYLPEHLRAFRAMLGRLDAAFERLCEETDDALFHALLRTVWVGERGNAGLRGARQRLDGRDALADTFGSESARALAEIDKRTFYERFLTRRFATPLNQIVRLYLLQAIPPEVLDVRAQMEHSGLRSEALIGAHELVAGTLCQHYDLRLREAGLFEERFDDTRHEQWRGDRLFIRGLVAGADQVIDDLPNGTICDLVRVGMASEPLDLDMQPTVAVYGTPPA